MLQFDCGTSLEGPHELFLFLFLGVVKLLEAGASLEEGKKCARTYACACLRACVRGGAGRFGFFNGFSSCGISLLPDWRDFINRQVLTSLAPEIHLLLGLPCQDGLYPLKPRAGISLSSPHLLLLGVLLHRREKWSMQAHL